MIHPRLLAAVALLLGTCLQPAAVPADEPPARPNPADRRGGQAIGERVERALSELDLTADQRAKLDALRPQIRRQLEALRAEMGDLSPQDRRQRIQAVMGEIRQDMGQILTEAQQETLRSKLQAAVGGGGRQRRAEREVVNATPATQPSAQPVMIQRLRASLQPLKLTETQQEKVEAILSDAAEELVKLRQEASGGGLATLGEKVREHALQTRRNVRQVLTPEQRRAFDEQQTPTRPSTPPPEKPSAKPAPAEDGMMGQSPDPMGAPAPAREAGRSASEPDRDSGPPAAAAPATGIKVGDPAPPLRLVRPDGRPASLSTYGGKPLVLVFGSFTSPTFRDKVPVFEAWRKSLRNRASVVFVYTREAYPTNEWDVQRNLDEQIAVNQHATLEERLKLARDTRDGLKISVDILVDDIDDGMATTFDALPNGAVVLDARGRVVGRQKWADPHGLDALVDDALKAK